MIIPVSTIALVNHAFVTGQTARRPDSQTARLARNRDVGLVYVCTQHGFKGVARRSLELAHTPTATGRRAAALLFSVGLEAATRRPGPAGAKAEAEAERPSANRIFLENMVGDIAEQACRSTEKPLYVQGRVSLILRKLEKEP